jgi:cerevisin
MASPHICGLLSYFLSLTPMGDSDFAVPVTPAKLKKRMVDIGIPGMLTEIPSGTPNVLAWNGGVKKNGTSDFSFSGQESIEHGLKEAVHEQFEKIEKEGLEWMEKARKFINKEVENVF